MFNPLDHPGVFALPLRLAPSGWLSHVPFAAFVVDILRPRSIVELGCYQGVSYCAFCQAVTSLNLETQCYAIDTWAGDPHAGHYGADVLGELQNYHDPLYGHFSHLVQSSFDDALGTFRDGFIDLLHIDGFHTYEAVKTDFQNWLPKISDRGTILFHDIHVQDDDFGVWRLWEELRVMYPSFEFLHGNGLGLIAVGSKINPALSTLLSSSPEESVRIRQFFEHAGHCAQMAYEVQTLGKTVEKQTEAIDWAKKLYEEETRLGRNLPFRVTRALARHGFVGASTHLARRIIQ